ncbi:hypothetical protein F5877DRAFT_53540 [Lentinula edodes]|nr:hypothetical protein F5877DRAFT_53540 [Lentinula edodes]
MICSALISLNLFTIQIKVASKDYPKGKALPENLKLDRERLKDFSYDKPYKLFYGFGVNLQDFIEYHQKHNLPKPPPSTKLSIVRQCMVHQVLEDLQKHCDFDWFELHLAMAVEYKYILVIYDSYTFDRAEMEDAIEQEIYKVLRDRMEVCKSQEPRWFRTFYDIYQSVLFYRG